MTELVALSPADARTLTDRIKVGVEAVWELVKQAYEQRAWAALGYSAWDDYCTREFGTSRLRLPREERAEVVASLRESGLSTRAIAAATGISDQTVRADLDKVRDFTQEPQPITGTDGKTYTPKPRPEPEPDWEAEEVDPDWIDQADDADLPPLPPGFCPDDLAELNTPQAPAAPRRKPLPEAFDSATYELRRAVERVVRLSEDDRLNKNKDQVKASNLSDLIRAREALASLIELLEG